MGATLNWRRDPDYEKRMNALAIRIQQTKNDREQIENDILQIESDILQVESDIVQIEKETEQLRRENARLRQQNARGRQLLASIDALCFPPESSSTPAPATRPDSRPASP